jgi:CheY-like chemotaxis protein
MKLVLVVEDEPGNAEVLRMVLEAAGYRVSVARDGKAGLELLAGERPAVILADFAMPSVSGADLGLAVRADPGLCGIPFVILSGFSQTTVREAFDDYDSFVAKPLYPEVLVPLVAHLARYGRPARKFL